MSIFVVTEIGTRHGHMHEGILTLRRIIFIVREYYYETVEYK